MAEAAAMVATWFAEAGTAAAAASAAETIAIPAFGEAIGGSLAAGAGITSAGLPAVFGAEAVGIGAGAGALGGSAAFAVPNLYGAAQAAGTASNILGGAAKAAAQGAGSSLVGGLLRPSAPTVKPTPAMPDPLAQEEARRRKIAEQTQRSGRASTIMTAPSGGDKLGG